MHTANSQCSDGGIVQRPENMQLKTTVQIPHVYGTHTCNTTSNGKKRKDNNINFTLLGVIMGASRQTVPPKQPILSTSSSVMLNTSRQIEKHSILPFQTCFPLTGKNLDDTMLKLTDKSFHLFTQKQISL